MALFLDKHGRNKYESKKLSQQQTVNHVVRPPSYETTQVRTTSIHVKWLHHQIQQQQIENEQLNKELIEKNKVIQQLCEERDQQMQRAKNKDIKHHNQIDELQRVIQGYQRLVGHHDVVVDVNADSDTSIDNDSYSTMTLFNISTLFKRIDDLKGRIAALEIFLSH